MTEDVAVVGGGPGGAAAALAMARAGVGVALYRPRRPGEKPCGGGVPDAFLPSIDGFAPPLEAVEPGRIYLENASGASVELRAPGLRVFRRVDLDAALEAAAVAAGARLVEAKVERIEPARGSVAIHAGGEARRFGWAVGADGARSLARRSIGIAPGPESLGLGGSLQGSVPEVMAIGFPDVGDAYCWIFPRPGGASVGVAFDRSRLSRGAAAATLDRFLDRHLAGGRGALARGRRYCYPIPVWAEGETAAAVVVAAGSRVLLVGDAAGVADPLTREGIRYAVLSGRWAAESVIDGSPEAYGDRLVAGLTEELGRASRAARVFFDLPVCQWMVPVAHRHPGIRSILGDLLTCRRPYTGLRRGLLRAAIGRYACAGPEPGREPVA